MGFLRWCGCEEAVNNCKPQLEVRNKKVILRYKEKTIMAKDLIHESVRVALEKDGWTIY